MKALLLRPVLCGLLAITLILVACGGASDSTEVPGPPSAEELAAQGFLLPELPRITSEQLKQMMDNGKPVVVVDTRIEFFFNMARIPQSINIVYEPGNENPEGFSTLPKDRPIVFWCD